MASRKKLKSGIAQAFIAVATEKHHAELLRHRLIRLEKKLSRIYCELVSESPKPTISGYQPIIGGPKEPVTVGSLFGVTLQPGMNAPAGQLADVFFEEVIMVGIAALAIPISPPSAGVFVDGGPGWFSAMTAARGKSYRAKAISPTGQISDTSGPVFTVT